eukprot:CAMPEP_0114671478 /NCGR_PEP_ID=MMETSP0191-20121206/41229_1 /TAXON_ID=126664 /ORGANISM="Sorites sp." /LENGTH=515 /DNA_ID=CAMNT_0001931423 /DNA_START=36 /DNA_END=1583 /DNA_ORIENTATION=-
MSSELTQQQESDLNNFVALTGATKEIASEFLKACSWSCDTAVSRFFDYNGDVSKLKPPAQTSMNNIGTGGGGGGGMMGGMMGGFGGLLQSFIGGGGGMMPQQQGYRQPVSNPPNNDMVNIQDPQGFGMDNNGYRQADQYFTEQLVPNGPYNQYGSSYFKQKKDNMKNLSKEWQKGKKNKKSDQLAKLFGDPDYKFRGTWDDAKSRGINKKKWVLVNLQVTSNFVSHCLNRDVFNDGETSEMIKSNFIFYQWSNETDKAKKLMSLYQKYTLPALFVVDPNTGLDCWDFEIPDAPDKVIIIKTKIMDFLDKYSDPSKKPKQKPVSKKKPNTNVLHSVNEDEILQKAIAESLKANNNTRDDDEWNDDNNDGNLDDWGDNDDNDIDMMYNNNNSAEQKSDKPDGDINDISNNNNNDDDGDEKVADTGNNNEPEYPLSVEPDKSDKDSTALRLRLPSGMVTRRFKKSTKIGELYQWCIESMNDVKPFILMQQMPRMKLEDKDKTLKDLQLFNTMLLYHEL